MQPFQKANPPCLAALLTLAPTSGRPTFPFHAPLLAKRFLRWIFLVFFISFCVPPIVLRTFTFLFSPPSPSRVPLTSPQTGGPRRCFQRRMWFSGSRGLEGSCPSSRSFARLVFARAPWLPLPVFHFLSISPSSILSSINFSCSLLSSLLSLSKPNRPRVYVCVCVWCLACS